LIEHRLSAATSRGTRWGTAAGLPNAILLAEDSSMSRKFDLTSLEPFVGMRESKNIAQADEVENITASAISDRVVRLDEL
jgi:hypothetical protein